MLRYVTHVKTPLLDPAVNHWKTTLAKKPNIPFFMKFHAGYAGLVHICIAFRKMNVVKHHERKKSKYSFIFLFFYFLTPPPFFLNLIRNNSLGHTCEFKKGSEHGLSSKPRVEKWKTAEGWRPKMSKKCLYFLKGPGGLQIPGLKLVNFWEFGRFGVILGKNGGSFCARSVT